MLLAVYMLQHLLHHLRALVNSLVYKTLAFLNLVGGLQVDDQILLVGESALALKTNVLRGFPSATASLLFTGRL